MKKLLLFLCLMLSAPLAYADDAWMQLQSYYGTSSHDVVVYDNEPAPARKSTRPDVVDTWAVLQDYYVPFTEQEEFSAHTDPHVGRNVSRKLHKALRPYRSLISDASQQFNVPAEVIGAVIMVESSGNPRAKARTSSAKGLMQTIRSTFADARQGLKRHGVQIVNNPYDPHASIMAGSWYLDRMFRQMEKDAGRRFDRRDMSAWRKVAEYYYAGPNHGRKRAGVVIMYAGGRRLVVDKAGYAQKVMRWARLMA